MNKQTEINSLRERLKEFMGEKDLTFDDIGKLTNRYPQTIWKFINRKTVPHERTLYRIRKLIGEI